MTADETRKMLEDIAGKLRKDYIEKTKKSGLHITYSCILGSMAMLSVLTDLNPRHDHIFPVKFDKGGNKIVNGDGYKVTYENDKFVFISCKGKRHTLPDDQHLYELPDYGAVIQLARAQNFIE